MGKYRETVITFGTRTGGGVAVFFYHDAPPFPNQSIPATQAERGELPSGDRRPEMVHCLAEPEGIQHGE